MKALEDMDNENEGNGDDDSEWDRDSEYECACNGDGDGWLNGVDCCCPVLSLSVYLSDPVSLFLSSHSHGDEILGPLGFARLAMAIRAALNESASGTGPHYNRSWRTEDADARGNRRRRHNRRSRSRGRGGYRDSRGSGRGCLVSGGFESVR